MWTEHDPVANRYNIMNLSAEEARALCADLANAGNYSKLLKREPRPAMQELQRHLQASLYGTAQEPAGTDAIPNATEVLRLKTNPTT
jgi:hypothetical protein